MYPLDLSVAAGARRAQFSSSAILTGTKMPKPPAYDCAYTGGFGILVPVGNAQLKNCARRGPGGNGQIQRIH